MDTRTALRALAFLRMGVGLWLIWSVLPNLDHSFIEGLPPVIEHFSQTNPNGAYRWLLNNIAAPNIEQLGTVLTVGQLLVGSALFIGFLTRIAAFIGALYALNLLLATAQLSAFHQSLGIILLITFVAMMIGDVGGAYGIDGFLFKKKPDSKESSSKFKSKKQKQAVEALNKQLKKSSGKKPKVKSH